MSVHLRVRGIDTERARALQRGAVDAHGQPALRRKAEGLANPCRHCLELIAEGDDKLVLAYRPFDTLQPYAEVGPIFLHDAPCARYESDLLPGWFAFLEPAMLRGYGPDHWIRYETGHVIPGGDLDGACRQILSDPSIQYVDIRSKYGCFQCRVEREGNAPITP